MPVRNDRVVAMVRTELAKNGQVDNATLLTKARSIDPKLRRMTSRQFHGTYRLPALREAKRANGGSTSKASAPAAPARRTRGPGRRKRAAAEQAAMQASVAATSSPAASESRQGNTAAEASPPAATPVTTTALSRPRAAEREVIRQVLQSVAREALGVEDRAAFVRLLDSLDQRAELILGVATRH